MPTNLPMCCSSAAFHLLARQAARINHPDALLQGAVAVAAHQLNSIDPAHVDATLQNYADMVRSRVRGEQPQATLAHLHELLFDEEKYGGNVEDYYNPNNSYLPMVLHTRRGLPITLSLIYKSVAERLGFKAHGIGFPGHFLTSIETGPDAEPMIIDPFAAGRVVSVDELHQRLREMFGPEVEWTDEFIQPVTNRIWLTRMLQNLLTTFGSNGQYTDVAAVLEMEMLLWPEQDRLQRDLALVLARLGLAQPASAWLNRYLQNNPDDPQKTDLEQLLEVLEA